MYRLKRRRSSDKKLSEDKNLYPYHILLEGLKHSHNQRRATIQYQPVVTEDEYYSDKMRFRIWGTDLKFDFERVAVGRKPSLLSQKRPQRRSSEPFLLDPITLQNKWNRKASTANRNYIRRRVSTTTTLPASSKQKLQALAKDELLASLNVPLSRPEPVAESAKIVDESLIDTAENKKNIEKERKEHKRMLIIEEILETEKNYISCLETLNTVFRTQLEQTSIITSKDLATLFPSYLNDIKSSHSWFMRELEDRMHHLNWRGIIGDIFAKMTSASANLLEIYTSYVNAFPKAISTLSKCTRSSHKFRKFLEDCYENPLVERLDLPSFLLSPVQRLPRYILLLRELLKYTDDDHPDNYFIGEAMREMQSLIGSLNDSIQNSMEFYSASEGRRKKMSRQTKKRNKRTSQLSLRPQKKGNLNTLNENKGVDDQGYCSFSERKDESPEDDQDLTPRRKSRSTSWKSNKRSMSLMSTNSEENKNTAAMLRRKEFSRSANTRKSWRRSLGAVFSQIWSKEESNDHNDHDSRRSSTTGISPQVSLEGTPQTVLKTKSETDLTKSTEEDIRRKNSLARRKIAIIHSPPKDDEETQVDGSVNDINNLIRESSIDEQNIQTSAISVEVGSLSSSRNSVAHIDRKNSIASNKSRGSLKLTESPQFFRRGKLRGSAGPIVKSLFRKNKELQKTRSWDELNIDRTDDGNFDRKQKRFSISLRKPKSSKEDAKNIFLKNSRSSTSISSKSLTRDVSISSTETISSRTSNKYEENDVNRNINNNNDTSNSNNNPSNSNIVHNSNPTGDNNANNSMNSSATGDNNNNDQKSSREIRKNKFIKTIRSFVSKK